MAQLAVGRERTAGYAPTAFGAWRDADGDGCTTPAEVFMSEAVRPPRRTAGCRLIGGRWVSRYDGLAFTTTSGLVVDHVVSLREAWQSGAWNWDTATRRNYLNDLGYARTLIAVSAGADRAKGENEPHHWMPVRSRCDYLVSWVAVKWRWRLKAHAIEKAYLERSLRACGWPPVTSPSRPRISTRAASGSVAPSAWNCPPSAPIKGNAESMIYHLPGDAFYTRTNPEDCFATEAAARAAGYRRAKTAVAASR